MMKRCREDDMANCLMLLSKVGDPSRERVLLKGVNGGFKCKTCNRQFLSFQALGGHRASHKKLKLMDTDLSSCHLLPSSTKKLKMHMCSICGLQFEIGQALGGHMRKHRAAVPTISNANKTKMFQSLCLDLNLTPYENDLNLNLRTPVLNFSL